MRTNPKTIYLTKTTIRISANFYKNWEWYQMPWKFILYCYV